MITKDILIQLIEGCHLYDITDIMIQSNRIHYERIHELYEESLVIGSIVEPKNYKYDIKIIMINIIIGVYIYTFKRFCQGKLDKKGVTFGSTAAYASATYTRAAYKRSVEAYNKYIPVLNIAQVLWSLQNQLYRSKGFYSLYESKVIEYILEQQKLGNLSEEVIDKIMMLLN
jgi:hypothetical protein